MKENASQPESVQAPEATPSGDTEKATSTPEASPQVVPQADTKPEAAPAEPELPPLEPKPGLAEEIRREHGEDVSRCYQCLKCSAGCPMTFAMDYPPSQIMRMVQLGQEDLILQSKTIWVCLSCNTCSIRCPNDIDIALVIDALCERALKKGVQPAVPNVALFHKYFLDNVRKRGRTFEGELLARYQLKTGQAIQNAGLGMRMFFKGRMSLLPESVENKRAFREICKRVEERGGSR